MDTIGVIPKAGPGKLVKRYFESHSHVANWMMTIAISLLPVEALNLETARVVAAF